MESYWSCQWMSLEISMDLRIAALLLVTFMPQLLLFKSKTLNKWLDILDGLSDGCWVDTHLEAS